MVWVDLSVLRAWAHQTHKKETKKGGRGGEINCVDQTWIYLSVLGRKGERENLYRGAHLNTDFIFP